MTLLWMSYLLLLGALLAAAAWCADTALRATGRGSRIVWAAAIVATFTLPLVGLLIPTRATTLPAASAPTSAGTDATWLALLAPAEWSDVRTVTPGWERFDRPLSLLWLGLAVTGLAWVALSRRRLRSMSRQWRASTVAGEPVLVAPDAGPAAVSDRGGQIVLPAWALAIDEQRLSLMLAHERSHLAARDPQLLTAATIAVALAPWNPALWWQLRRLRLAVEIDCDRRVLRRFPDVAAYGALLLDVARRETSGRPRFAVALSAPTPTTTLERRIRSMTDRRPRHILTRTLALGALATVLVVAACETPHPTGLKPEATVTLDRIANVAEERTATVDAPTLDDVKEVIGKKIDAETKAAGFKRAYIIADDAGQVKEVKFDRAGEQSLGAVEANAIKAVNVFKVAPDVLTKDSAAVLWIKMKAAKERLVEERLTTVKPDTGRDAVKVSGLPIFGATKLANPPLFVVDGTEVVATDVKSALGTMTPDSIAAIEVFKGDAARATYGERGANGVVLITTKRGGK